MITLDELISKYEHEIENASSTAKNANNRAYGGVLRSLRGGLLEELVRDMVRIAWITELGQSESRLTIDKLKEPVKMNPNYIDTLDDDLTKRYLASRINEQVYYFGTDVHVKIDGKMALAIECKSYTENAMIKRIIFDACLMKELHPNLKRYFLIQVQSQLGGDYSQLPDHPHGSPATNALLSRSSMPIEIITLMKGERKVDKPIYDEEKIEKLDKKQMQKAIDEFVNDLKPYAR